METSALEYPQLSKTLSRFLEAQYSEGKAFLGWFLENIYRLDETSAVDALCDHPNDKGIDGIWVDDLNSEIHFFQTKTSQNLQSTIGDVALKSFVGSLNQFDTPEKIDGMLSGNANSDLKNILLRENIKALLAKGYRTVGVFASNQNANNDTNLYMQTCGNVILYDKKRIAEECIDLQIEGGVDDTFQFSIDYAGCLKMDIGEKAKVYILPASAFELVKMKGIGDATLFKRNVRYSLGNTAVNKSIASSVKDKKQHGNFPLYHNGITVICEEADLDLSAEKLTVKNYVVVNGAQSLSTFYNNKKSLTADLRVFVKVISLNDERLSRTITFNSNNQNAIKAKDLRSDDDLMLRLSKEFQDGEFEYNFEIKRGEKFDNDNFTISNDDAGRLLLAFDLRRPYNCHQIYRIFDENYAEIFGRPEVSASRIIFIQKLMNIIVSATNDIDNKQMSHYALTRYFLLSVLREIMDMSQKTASLARKPSISFNGGLDNFFKGVSELLPEMITDFNHLISDQSIDFDYKRDLKSPERTKAWRTELIRTYQKDLSRGKATDLSTSLL